LQGVKVRRSGKNRPKHRNVTDRQVEAIWPKGAKWGKRKRRYTGQITFRKGAVASNKGATIVEDSNSELVRRGKGQHETGGAGRATGRAKQTEGKARPCSSNSGPSNLAFLKKK